MPAVRFVALALALAFSASPAAPPALAALGDCGQPLSSGASPVASDALGVLRAAVGTFACDACVCDVGGDGSIAASDALKVLQVAVGSQSGLDCLVCPKETTIGNIGGNAVSLDGRVRLTIPPGALAKDTKITVEEAPATLLPAALRTQGNEEAWRLKPKGLTLAVTGKVSIARNETLLAGGKVIGAPMALVVGLDGSDVDFLDTQSLTIDGRVGIVRVGAELDELGVVAVVPLDVTARISGFPSTDVGSQTVTLTARVEQDGSEETVDIHNPAYTDDNFGVWAPIGGEINNTPIKKVTDGVFQESFDYACTGTAVTNYAPSIRTLVDVLADVPGAPLNLVHRTFPLGQVACEP